jgi:hypothetical protein
MYARSISVRLKPDSLAALTQIIEEATIPLLRKRKGFQDEITLIARGAKKAIIISFWEYKEDADAYSREADPEVLKALEQVSEGAPHLRTYDVCSSTYRNRAATVVIPI